MADSSICWCSRGPRTTSSAVPVVQWMEKFSLDPAARVPSLQARGFVVALILPGALTQRLWNAPWQTLAGFSQLGLSRCPPCGESRLGSPKSDDLPARAGHQRLPACRAGSATASQCSGHSWSVHRRLAASSCGRPKAMNSKLPFFKEESETRILACPEAAPPTHETGSQ